MISLAGKTGLVMGIANKRSIAWSIAQALDEAGMRLAVTYQGERLEQNVRQLATELKQPALILPCDVTKDEEVQGLFASIGAEFGGLDALMHAIAYAPKEELEGQFVTVARGNWNVAMEVSAYSLPSLVNHARPLLAKNHGAVAAMTYHGSEKVMPKYNVMGVAKAALEASIRYLASDLGPEGIRVNGVSAGPVNTLAARGIAGFTEMLHIHAERSPLKRNVELEEVANTALFLLSPMSSGITGEVIYVDCGYNIMGM